MRNLVLISLIPLVFTACATSEPEIKFEKPRTQIPKPQPEVKRNKGSLYSMEGASLFADKKDLQIGDIIQVNIDESLSQNSKNKRELTANRNNSLGGGVFAATNGNTLGNTTAGVVDKLNRNLGVGFNSTSSTSDSGEVKTQFDETFSTSISAIIDEVYLNGNYLIRGTKELLIDGQKQIIIITGVIRPYDISSDNSIGSSQVANLKLLYDKEGSEADVMETPWGLKILRKLWPF